MKPSTIKVQHKWEGACHLCIFHVPLQGYVIKVIYGTWCWRWIMNCTGHSGCIIQFNPVVNIGSDNGLAPVRCQVITWTNADLLSIGPFWTYLSEIWIIIQTFSFKKMHLTMASSANSRPFCSGFNVLNVQIKLGDAEVSSNIINPQHATSL